MYVCTTLYNRIVCRNCINLWFTIRTRDFNLKQNISNKHRKRKNKKRVNNLKCLNKEVARKGYYVGPQTRGKNDQPSMLWETHGTVHTYGIATFYTVGV